MQDLGDHLVIRSRRNPTHWWGNFLLLSAPPAPEAADDWIARFHATFPTARHVALGFDGTDGSVEDLAPFTALGYSAEAQTVMTATDVHAPAHVSRDAELRMLTTDDDWEQSVELRVRCRDAELDADGYRDYAMAAARTNRAMVAAGHGAWFGAYVDGRLACQMGLVRAGPGSPASRRSRRTRTSGVGVSPARWCTSPAVAGSNGSAQRRSSWWQTPTTSRSTSIEPSGSRLRSPSSRSSAGRWTRRAPDRSRSDARQPREADHLGTTALTVARDQPVTSSAETLIR